MSMIPQPVPQAVELLPPSNLRPYSRNARTHSRKQIREIASSIERFGFTNPVLVDDGGGIIAGHGRVEAAKLLNMPAVPVLRLSHLSTTERQAYVIADNRLAEKAGWDREILAIELQSLIDLSFEVELTGFETADIDLVLEEAADARDGSSEPEDDVPEPVQGRAVTCAGDMWVLGAHRLLCGNAMEAEAYATLLGGEKAQLVVTDPPYNVRIDGHVSGSGRHREFAFASGEMSEAEFTAFLGTAFRHLADHSTDGSLNFVCMDWRHMFEALGAGRSVYPELKNLVVWNKSNGGMGSLYRSKHELIFVWKSGQAAHINNVELGRFGRNRTNVWDYPGVNTFRQGRLEELALHPTVKPVALIADAIRDCSRRQDIVLDPFCGSGTMLIAAEKTGRRARAVEIDPAYVDVAVRRWQAYTGKSAKLVATGEAFEDAEQSRNLAPAGEA